MPDRPLPLDTATEHMAITRAWAQVDVDELASVLRTMPAKLRNRMLSRMKTPSSKMTPITGRLLLTNVARSAFNERIRTADVVVHPATGELGDRLDVTSDAGGLAEAVAELAGTWGRSIIVLAAVNGLLADAERFAAVLVACDANGYLDGELAELAGTLAPLARVQLAEDAADSDEELIDGLDLDAAWELANAAAARVVEAVGAGLAPAAEDMDDLALYSLVLDADARRWGVPADLHAVRSAEEAAHAASEHAELAVRLRRLSGPDELAEDLAAAAADADALAVDPALADRLRRLLAVVSDADPGTRFALARELRGQDEPPSEKLLDAAMVGLLSVASGPADIAWPVTDAADASQAEAGAGDVAAPARGDMTSRPARQASLLEVDDALDPGSLFAPHPAGRRASDGTAPAPGEVAGVPGGDAPVADEADEVPGDMPAGGEPISETLDPDGDDGSTPADQAGRPGGPVDADDAPATSAPVLPSATVGVAVPPPERSTPVEAPEAPGPADAGPARAAHDVVSAAGGGEVIDPEECTRTLAGLIATRRFSLARHLAAALDQDLRAEVLAEAALAEGVRRSTSPAAADMVERALQHPLPADDLGSVALRAASGVRVALLDPSAGATEVLRSLVDSLGATPALRGFVLAVINPSAQHITLSASGSAGNVDQAYEQAQAIASWADDTLNRPRRNLLYRGIEIFKALTAADEPLGRVLTAVAANDDSRLDEVRRLCRQLGPKELSRAIADTDTRFGGRERGNPVIHGTARQQLLRNLGEIVQQASAWCDAVAVRTRPASPQRLAAQARELGEHIEVELAGGSDDVTAACLTAAAASVTDTISLFGSGSLDGDDLEVAEALDRDLVFVDGLDFDTTGAPARPATLSELVAAAHTPRASAFERRIAGNDFAVAEAVLSLPGDDDGNFDVAAATKILRAAEREAVTRMRQRWEDLERTYNAARARGRVRDTDAAALGGALAHANPQPAGDAPRRDLGRVAVELDELAANLDASAARRRELVHADIDDAIAAGDINAAWAERLRDLLASDEVGAAEEYLHRARGKDTTPQEASAYHEPDGVLATILAEHPDGVSDTVVEAVRSASGVGALDFTGVDAADRRLIVEALDSWRLLAGPERPTDLDRPLGQVLRLLGIIPRSVNRSRELRAASTSRYWFVEVDGATSGYAYVPDYGTRSSDRRRVMLCWATDLPVAQLWSLARSQGTDDQPVYVLYFGTLTAEARVGLARVARDNAGQGVVVIDAAVILRCAAAARQSYDVTMRAVLPYAAPNPYDPNLLVGMPAEMFYGRRRERDGLKRFNGPSFISGGRRFGKSALLRSAQAELVHDNPDVTVELIVIQDVAADPRNDPGELWPRVAQKLIEDGVLPGDVAADADGVCAGIRAWLAANERKRLLLMLDECDFFLRADADHGFSNVARLRDTMADGGGRFKVVFSGLQHVARYRNLPNQPLSHFPEPLLVGPLEAAAASELVRRPLHAIGWAITDDQVDRIVTYCACNPSVIQLACADLIGRLRRSEVTGLAPWAVPDAVIDGLLRSPEVERGVRDRLFLTLELDHRYKLLAYLLAWRASTDGLHIAVPPAALRRLAVEFWPEGFSADSTDDVRALCQELVGLGVFAGDAETGYRMLSPGMVRVFGNLDDITEELESAPDRYEKDRAVGAAGSRMAVPELGAHRYSPLTASQLADVIGVGATQLRVVVGSRATCVDDVAAAIAAARDRYVGMDTVEVNLLRDWREKMRAPASGHLVVVSNMTSRGGESSWDQSVDSARRRGATRSERGTRSAVLVAGPGPRWLLSRMVTRPDGTAGDLVDVTVALRRVDLPALQAWDRIVDLDLPALTRQRRLLEVTGGWPLLVEQVLSNRAAAGGFDRALDALAAELATPEGASQLIAQVGLDPGDRDLEADPGLVATFDRLVEMDWSEPLDYLAGLLEMDGIPGENDPAEAVAILALLGALDEDGDGSFQVEPVLASAWRLRRSVPAAG